MLFLKNLKDKLNKFIKMVQSSFEKLKNQIFKKTKNSCSFENIKIYHHLDFSYAFVTLNNIYFLVEDEFNDIIDYIVRSIGDHLKKDEPVLINIITKVILNDKLNISYIHSLTYKELFNFKDLTLWKTKLEIDLKELLNQYNDSQLQKIEFRFDYIRSGDLK